jgi:hypothetical protein
MTTTKESVEIHGATIRRESVSAEEGITESIDINILTEFAAALIHMASVPTDLESFTIGIDSVSGSANDTVLKSYNFAAGSAADLNWLPGEGLYLFPGDKITLSFANSGSVVTGAQVVLKEYL